MQLQKPQMPKFFVQLHHLHVYNWRTITVLYAFQRFYWKIFAALLSAGEGLKVFAAIQNNSSREIKPKYLLYQKHSFFARGKRRLNTIDVLKEEGEPISPSTNQNVTKVLHIPPDIGVSILNCSILKVEHRLRVSIWPKKSGNAITLKSLLLGHGLWRPQRSILSNGILYLCAKLKKMFYQWVIGPNR